MDKSQFISQFKAQYPNLTKQINEDIITLSNDEYESTINAWADACLAKELKKIEVKQSRQTKISAYEKLGLTPAEIEALLPTPADPIL